MMLKQDKAIPISRRTDAGDTLKVKIIYHHVQTKIPCKT